MITGTAGAISALLLGGFIITGFLGFVYLLYSDMEQLKVDKDSPNVEPKYSYIIFFTFTILLILTGV